MTYKELYFKLYARMCDAIEALDNHNHIEARDILAKATIETEELILEAEDDILNDK